MDIESHNDDESIAKGETSMWLGCYLDENSKVDDEDSYFYDMDEFLDRLEQDSSPKIINGKRPVKNICCYIYNLSFEWSFLIPYMEKRGFEFKRKIENDDEFVFNTISTKSCSSVWQVQMKFHKKSGIIYLRDLAKIFGGGLGKVAKAFGLETQKGEIDYRLNRLHRRKRYATKKEKVYCFKDTRILIEILLEMSKRDDKDFWQSVSMASYSMRKLLKRGWPRATKPYQKYRELYPELSQEETDFLRKGVSGGITYAPENWQFKVINAKIGHV